MRVLSEKQIWAVGSLALAAATLNPAAAWAVVPVNHPPPFLTPVPINLTPGDQSDPHVSGDWAAYTDGVSIRYYRFSTGVDEQIPMGSSARDLLSDISGSRIVFSRIITGVTNAVMVFDAATEGPAIEVDAAPFTNRLGAAIGGDTVAYVDFGLHARGELVIHDLATSTSVRITNDAAFDQNPSVSPSGDVVVWEHCPTSSTNCDIGQAQAVRNGPLGPVVWSVDVSQASLSAEGNPDTSGTLVVYDSLRAGNSDIFWRPVTGGPEVQLQLSGYELNPRIAGDFIVFESRPTLFDTTDLFVYDVANNRLFQITDTPLVTEQLNDVAVLPDRSVRMVWVSDEDGFDQRNIWSATFALPRDAPSQIADLITLVLSFNLKQGIENSLDAKLQNVLAALDAAGAGDETTACNKLDAFIHEVQAQTDKAITAAQAAQLIAATNQVKAAVGCP